MVAFDLTQLDKRIEGDVQFYSYNPQKYSNSGKALTAKMPIFYNPIQELNRSLSLIGFRAFYNQFSVENDNDSKPNPPFVVCDCMAASGIRTLRLKKFLDPNVQFIINDLNNHAIRIIHENAQLNNISLKEDHIYNEDANYLFNLMRKKREYASIVDIDPFGSPNIFIENSIRCLRKNGLLGVTATDTAVFFGIRKDACIRKYNTRPLRSSFLKEVGLRILLYFIACRAHLNNKAINPVLSLSFDHYIRLFIQINNGKKAVNQNIKKIGYVFWCPDCDWRTTSNLTFDSKELDLEQLKKCPLCMSKTQFGGPMWLGNLHNSDFIGECEKLIEYVPKSTIPSKKKIIKVLSIVKNEDNFPVGYFDLHKLCDMMNLSVSSSRKIMDSIRLAGYQASLTHINPRAIKSNIPLTELKEILISLGAKKN